PVAGREEAREEEEQEQEEPRHVAEDPDDHADDERRQAAVPSQDLPPVRQGAERPREGRADEHGRHEIERHCRTETETPLKPFDSVLVHGYQESRDLCLCSDRAVPNFSNAASMRSREKSCSSHSMCRTPSASGSRKLMSTSARTFGFRKISRTSPFDSMSTPSSASAGSSDPCLLINASAFFGPIPLTPSLKSVPIRRPMSTSCSRVRPRLANVASSEISSGCTST